MNRPSDFLALMLVGVAVLGLLPTLLRRRYLRWPSVTAVLAAALGVMAAGVWLGQPWYGFWVTMSALALGATLVVILILTARWWPILAWSLLALGLIGLGSWWGSAVAQFLTEFGTALCTIEILHPSWLLLLLLVPFLVVVSRRNLGFITASERRGFWRRVVPSLVLGLLWFAGFAAVTWLIAWQRGLGDAVATPRSHYLIFAVIVVPALLAWTLLFMPLWRLTIGPAGTSPEWRPWVSLALRCAGVSILALALAEPRLRQENADLTVLFVVDRSLSIPEELGEDPANPGVRTDRRAQRIMQFINRAVEQRGAGRERDRAGLIVFGRRPRLELAPTDAPRFNLTELPPAQDGNYTDIAAALKLALASFPDGTGKRVVLITDGNENLGNAMEQAQLARSVGVQVDVLPLAAGQRNEDEVLVERVEAPPVTEQGANIPVRVMVRSFNPNLVEGRLTLKQITERERDVRVRRAADGGLGVTVQSLPGPSGVRITELDANSPLVAVGFQVGDEILRFNDTALTGEERAKVFVDRGKAGDVITLLVRRDGNKLVGDLMVRLRLGLNSFSFTRPLNDEQRSYTYEAEFFPLRIRDEQGKLVQEGRPAGDRVQNNRASTHVVARGQRRILVLENRPPGQEEQIVNPLLVEKLQQAGERKFRVDVRSVNVLSNYPDKEKLAVFLSDYDCVVLVNVPAEKVSEAQQEVLRGNTHDQGCGLVMIGGPESYGAGGWQNTAIEKALPVDCEIKSLKVQGKGGLVLIMHASEFANGNFWQKKIAKLAVERLGPSDMVGVIDFDFQCKWHVPFQEIAGNKAGIMAKIDTLVPGDMPDFDPALILAHKELTRPEYNLSTKHCIIISDGDPAFTLPVLAPFKRDKATVTTVGVATHGANEDTKMAQIAKVTGGRTYSVKQADQLPAIYIKESRVVSQSFVEERRFIPLVAFRSGPTDKLPDPPSLRGFVRTTAKTSPLVELPIITPRFSEQQFPLLAYWHYGLGKSIAFTSDAGDPKFWSKDWVEGGGGEGIFAKFWEQVIEWSLRPTESSRLMMTTDVRDGKIHIVIEARNEQNQLDTKLQLRGGVTTPTADGGRRLLRFVQKNSGQYEAEIKAEDAGSYFITAQATRLVKVKGKDGKEREIEEGVDSVRAGVTLPYSPEFADMESNTALLQRIAEATEGKRYEDDSQGLARTADSGIPFRSGLTRNLSLQPLWQWLVLGAGLFLLMDIATRRIALDGAEIKTAAQRLWARLRGQEVLEVSRVQFLERLQNRKNQVAGALDAARSTRRFEGQPTSNAPPLATASGPVAAPPRPGPSTGSEPTAPPDPAQGGALDRLLDAKKKLRDERKDE